MRKLLLVLIFFILNTVGSFGEPSNWETLKWISENVEKYSKGMEEFDTWNGGSKLAYKDEVAYDEDALYITRDWQQQWHTNGEVYLFEQLNETYKVPLKGINDIGLSKDGKSIVITLDEPGILHSGDYTVNRITGGVCQADKNKFNVEIAKAEFFTIGDKKILKGLESAFQHLIKSSEDGSRSLDSFFMETTDYYALGLTRFQEGNYQKALENFSMALSIGQDEKNSRYNLGRTYYEMGEYQKAVDEFNRVLEIAPDSQNTYYYLGRAYLVAGDYEGAMKALESAVDYDGNDSTAYYYLGMSNYKKNDYRKAASAFTRAISLDESLKQAYYYRGVSYYFLYKYGESLQDIDKYLESYPEDANAYYYKGLIYYISLEDDEAIGNFSKALELDPEFFRAYYYRGYLNYDNGQVEAAKMDYEKLFQMAPDDKFTQKLGKMLVD